MRARSLVLSLLISVALFCLFSASSVRAQIDGGARSYGLYENGVLVGELYREDTDPARYAEHWVLYPGYVYPSERNGVALLIRPSLTYYRNLADFFARVPFPTGSRYIMSSNLDGTALPGR